MRIVLLIRRSLTYYWRTNLSVVLGVATAVAVLAGALLVGDSVRASLRDLFLQRLGKADYIISAPTLFRAQLAADLEKHEQFKAQGFTATCPLIALRGTVLHEKSRRQAGQIRVYGVDERFWRFHNQAQVVTSLTGREVIVGAGLARDLNSEQGDSLLLTVEKPSDIPVESLHGRKEDAGLTLRLAVSTILSGSALGEFSPQPQQGTVHALFVPLILLQKELGQNEKANTILVSEARSTTEADLTKSRRSNALENILNDSARLEDLGVTLRPLEAQRSIAVETDSKLIDDQLADGVRSAAAKLSLQAKPVLAYLANSIRSKDRSVPYSLVAAVDKETFAQLGRGEGRSGEEESELPPIIINDWTANDLSVSVGAPLALEYYVWQADGRLETNTAQFRVAGIVPISGLAADRELVPEYPGITETQHLSDWDPPFPVDLNRVRKQDEKYWEQYRTTPKAFIGLEKGQELWQSRFGNLTSVRIGPIPEAQLFGTLDKYSLSLRAGLAPARMGVQIFPARAQGLEASRGATDFGEYFLYFSFFLVISALLLTALFFKLGVEQRLHEIGALEAMGFPPSSIRHLFLIEGLILSVIGSLIGLAGAIVYGQLLMYGLRTWWVEAVGTTMLTLHLNPISLILGAVSGVLAALVCIWLTLRSLRKRSTRSLLMGNVSGDYEMGRSSERETEKSRPRKRTLTMPRLAIVLTVLGAALLLLASLGQVGQVAGFFGGGTLSLVGLLCYQSVWLRRGKRNPISGTGWWPVSRLGFRNTTYRPGRSILCIALIASAAFIMVAVDAFRRDHENTTNDKSSGSGGFPLLAESLLPLIHDPNTPLGQEALNLTGDSNEGLREVSFTRFRVRAGDDASCLNLYRPVNPRIVAPDDQFLSSGRFRFQASLANTSESRANPWLLLNEELPDGTVPVIGDANSLTYVLHLKLGDELVLNQNAGSVRLRVVGALADSIFQSELLMAEKNFLRLFPQEQGHRLFLVETQSVEPTAAVLEDRLSDYGFDVTLTSQRLVQFHRVENTYLSTFQLLGGLGIVLGTMGMAAVLLRNVLERRRELALLRAVGYNSTHFTLMVIAENAFLLFCGLVTGTLCALLAVAPVVFRRAGGGPGVSLAFLLLLVLISGLTASLAATLAAMRSPLLPALKAE